jgi:V8-like Glu-specific endopeptidase
MTLRTATAIFKYLLLAAFLLSGPVIQPAAALSAHEDIIYEGNLAQQQSPRPERLVMQVIDNCFYKWYEYGSPDDETMQIELLEPDRKLLTSAEAEAHLESSRQWEIQYQQLNSDMQDDRTPLGDNEAFYYPYNTIGFLTIDFPNNYMRGTGFMVSPYTVLTNAHNIYIRAFGGWFETINFSPAQYEQQWPTVVKPYLTVSPDLAETNDQYLTFENSGDRESSINHDYAALFFDEKISSITTFLPLEFDSNPTMVSLIGYPGMVRDTETMGMWRSEGPVIRRDQYCLYYRAFTSGGNSGGPVLSYNRQANSYRVVAIHSFTTEGSIIYSGGPYFSEQNRQTFEKWLRWEPGQTTFPAERETQVDQLEFSAGDVNGDGMINVLDAVRVSRHVLQLDLLSGEASIRADVNQDGAINVRDINLIVQYALGLIDSFQSGE